MSTNNPPVIETQEAIDARLAQINAAVAGTPSSMPTFDSAIEEAAWLEANIGPASDGCPIDPQERLLCEGCQ